MRVLLTWRGRLDDATHGGREVTEPYRLPVLGTLQRYLGTRIREGKRERLFIEAATRAAGLEPGRRLCVWQDDVEVDPLWLGSTIAKVEPRRPDGSGREVRCDMDTSTSVLVWTHNSLWRLVWLVEPSGGAEHPEGVQHAPSAPRGVLRRMLSALGRRQMERP